MVFFEESCGYHEQVIGTQPGRPPKPPIMFSVAIHAPILRRNE